MQSTPTECGNIYHTRNLVCRTTYLFVICRSIYPTPSSNPPVQFTRDVLVHEGPLCETPNSIFIHLCVCVHLHFLEKKISCEESHQANVAQSVNDNVCSIEFRSKHSSNTVLCLLRNLMEQTLGTLCSLFVQCRWSMMLIFVA